MSKTLRAFMVKLYLNYCLIELLMLIFYLEYRSGSCQEYWWVSILQRMLQQLVLSGFWYVLYSCFCSHLLDGPRGAANHFQSAFPVCTCSSHRPMMCGMQPYGAGVVWVCHPEQQPVCCSCLFCGRMLHWPGAPYLAKAATELMTVLLRQCLECWDYVCEL